MDLIISHSSCPDGWTAAYIAKKRYPEAEILLLNHGIDPEPVIDQCVGKNVIMLDYSLRTRELNDRLNSVARTFHIYDHHKTAEAVLAGAEYATFDMKRSGAGLAWDYLWGSDSNYHNEVNVYNPTGLPGAPPLKRPWWVDYTEDRDLWNWALPGSHEVNAYLQTVPYTVEAWDAVAQITREAAVIAGQGARAYIEYYTRAVTPEAQHGWLTFEGHVYSTSVLNIPYAGVSEAGNALVKNDKADIALLWFERGDGITQFSLRSNKEGKDVDVSAIAKAFGGGGHKNASGFQVSLAKGRTIVDHVLGRGSLYWQPQVNELAHQTIPRSPGGCA